MVGRGRNRGRGSNREDQVGAWGAPGIGAAVAAGSGSGGFWSTDVASSNPDRQQGRPPGGRRGAGRGNRNANVNQKEKCDTSTQENINSIGERNFKQACDEIQKNVKEFLKKHQSEMLDDDDDDELDEEEMREDEVLERLYKAYGEERHGGRTQQYLEESFKSGASVCLVCIDSIKRNDPIWSCGSCYCSFHVQCVEKWAKDSIFQLAESQADTLDYVNKSALKWCCPKCRSEYNQAAIPTKYLCFCGKRVDPVFDPWLVPHSCGDTCSKKLVPECGHTCLLLCHPGPCPPCPRTVTNRCHCGKQPPTTRRCCSKTWSCGAPCKRTLSCGQHYCQDPCHEGECMPCSKKSKQPCSCGAQSQLRDCADPTWQCEKVCGKRHSCGHHVCQKICHSGECGPCPSSGLRTCPCGKSSHTLPCTREIPTCGDTCGKELTCGIHYCAERCHKGPCPTCRQFRVKQCRCGCREKEMACSKEHTCEIKCKRMRDCRRHACNKKCCTSDCPRCEQPCGRTLTCRQHKCESRCHQGPCYPCMLTYTINCPCGATSITVPCGRQKITPPPRCNKRCRKPPNCHHPEREKHKCHQGNCPTCKITCGFKLNCGHICPVPCHDAVPIKVVDTKKRAGPWEPVRAPYIKIEKQPCPPCQVPVPTTCFGRHETPNWPCSDIRPYKCGRKCGRLLACTNHTCSLDCHTVQGASDNKSFGTNCSPCEAQCSKPRPRGCTHKCVRACHSEECAQCQQLVKIKCHCGLNQLYAKCHLWNSDTGDKEEIQSCKNQCNKLMSCTHRCTKECHSGSCSSPKNCRKRVAVRCLCKRQRKDFHCYVINANAGEAKLDCDDVCIAKIEEKKKAQEEEEKKKQEEEEAKVRKELEEFERKREGRKYRRNRRQTESELEKSVWNSKCIWTTLALLFGLVSMFLYVALSVNLHQAMWG